MASTWRRRFDELERIVGKGTLRGKVVVDQPYAQRQHEDLSYAHVEGGGPYYLRRPLEARGSSYLKDIADTLLDDGGKKRMAQAMTNLATTELRRYVPSEYGNLRRSGAAFAYDDGVEYFRRPAERARLTQAEINQEGER